jgi:hypothetical protein
LLVAATFAVPLSACGGGGSSSDRAASSDLIQTCTTELAAATWAGVGQTGPPAQKVVNASRDTCREGEQQGLIQETDTQAESEAHAATLLREHARQLFCPIADKIAEGEQRGLPKEAFRYLTQRDITNFANGFCAAIGSYIRDDATLDQSALFRDHTDLVLPFCTAGFRAGLEAQPRVIPKENAAAASRELCKRLFRENLIVATGPGQFQIKRNSPKYKALLLEVLRKYGAQ